ncbi:MAG: hypothetical protein IJH75_00025 [Mogibacterium sp.]|nr:hypothetical protein [Mogibacterium sp.]
MNASLKKRKTIYVAAFVSISSLISFDFLTDVTEGFIIALSVVVMEIFIYCYEDLSALYIAVLSGIFSPLFRMTVLSLYSKQFLVTAIHVLPDMMYFFTFGIVYTLIYRYLLRKPKAMSNFPFTLVCCDLISNTMELTARGALNQQFFYDLKILSALLTVAVLRTALVVMVIAAIENYTSIMLRKEQEEELRRLMEQMAVIREETRVMDKNVAEVEEIMRKMYDLYRELDEAGYPKEIVARTLEMAKNTHEIKGDYQNVIAVLKELYDQNLSSQQMQMRDVVRLVAENARAMIRRRGWQIEVRSRVEEDFTVTDSFRMMSILRNLLTNAAEAIAEDESRKNGLIELTVVPESVLTDGEWRPYYRIDVRDNGPGLTEEEIRNVFMEGYSTKFNPATGDIQRGLGLSLTRDYVVHDLGGTIEVDSKPGEYADFRIRIPAERAETAAQKEPA